VLESPVVIRRAPAALLACVVGCVAHVPHPPFVAQPESALLPVDAPPPPARVELVPDTPSPSAVWVDGEWVWKRGRWAWLPGRWVAAPAGHSFSPWVFVRGADGRLWYAPGVWRDTTGAPVDPPSALAVAAVETGVVVTADGTTLVTGPNVRDRPKSTAPSPAPPSK
jgi:hypothetical protein